MPLTDDELRTEYVGKMGSDLGQLCHELRNEVNWLRHKWAEFQELFDRGAERIELLNTVASNFFYLLQSLFFEDAMLHMCRLSDPPEVSGHANLTMMRLPGLISDPALKAHVEAAAQQVRASSGFAREWRNKWLAHADLATHRSGHASSLPKVEGQNVLEALEALHDLLNSIERHYGIPPYGRIADPWGAKALMNYLVRAAG